MEFINEEEFKSKKTSDTIFVLGSGYSINKVREQDWEMVASYNSLAFNWFCRHIFEPTFFLIREQANLPFRKAKGETIKKLIKRVNRYKNTTCIICDVSHHTKKAYKYKNEKRLKGPCFLLKDDKRKKHGERLHKYMACSPVQNGLIHGTCTMYNVMHLVKYLEYKNIVFVGVDLYDSRYFWLGKNETRHSVAKKGKGYKDKHAVTTDVVQLVKRFRKFKIPMYVVNKKSKLKRVIPYKSFAELKEIL